MVNKKLLFGIFAIMATTVMGWWFLFSFNQETTLRYGEATAVQIIVARIEKISLWSSELEKVINNTKLGNDLISILKKVNLQAGCAIFEEDVEMLKQTNKIIEVTFRKPVNITISQWISPEDRDHILVDKNGYKIILKVEKIIFTLEGEYAGYILTKSVDNLGYKCWITSKNGEINKSWINEVEYAIWIEEGENSIFGVGYAVPGYAEIVAEMGARWVKIPLVPWGVIEPRPPQNGKHFYQWQYLDNLVKEYQDAGFHIQIVIKAACHWGAKHFASPPESWRRSYPPKEEHWDDYYQFVYALVERYDGDGYNDMPGLRYPIKYYEIESEAQNSVFWAGTVEEYGRLLKIAYQAAKKANPETKIILSGINFGNLFDDNPSQVELIQKIQFLPREYKKELFFIRKTLAMGDYYDVVDYHYNRDYVSAYGAVRWIREETAKHGYQKEIWAGDTASVPWITDGKHNDILEILTDPSHPRHQEVTDWLRAEQAKLAVKKFIIAAELGIKKVFLESIRDFPKNAYEGAEKESWFLAGFFNEDKTPRPVFYAYAQLTRKINNFLKIERLQGNGIYLYKVYFPDKKPIYIAWSERGPQKISLNISGPYVKLEKVIIRETENPIIKIMQVKRNKVTFIIDNTPVYIECVESQD